MLRSFEIASSSYLLHYDTAFPLCDHISLMLSVHANSSPGIDIVSGIVDRVMIQFDLTLHSGVPTSTSLSDPSYYFCRSRLIMTGGIIWSGGSRFYLCE